MPNVKVLSPDVIAKIAAGEVVDRPASVIKELIENSLDAGATSIEIHLKDAGKQLIHIKDNGSGIDASDLKTIFTRHATSKIKSIEDLETLSSMGFRGEALYSIAAIADVQLKTRTKTNDEAWTIHVRGGERLGFQPDALSGHGTDIKISELFFNTPARKKFLKSNTTELNQILNTVLPYTLIYPQIRFLLTHAGHSLLDVRPADSQTERVAAALNLDAHNLIAASQTLSDQGISVTMVLGNINIQRMRRDLQFIFVNKRPVQSKNIGFHLNDIYKLIFPPNIYPAFVVSIELDPAKVDCNIHPTKREVRIQDEARLCSLLRHTVEHTLMTKGLARSIEEDFASQIQTTPPNEGLPFDQIIFGPAEHQNRGTLDSFNRTYEPRLAETVGVEQTHLFPSTLKNDFGRARYVGSFINKYLLFESGRSLFLVDQHAAQERIMFEKFERQMTEGAIEIQNLLTPLVLKLTPQEWVMWEEAQEKLKSVGFEGTEFGDQTIAIHTHPVLIKNAERAVRTILAGDDIARCDRAAIARRACRASVMTGDKMSREQAEFQQRELLSCDDPFTCPHGRPTVVELTEDFLDRQFFRT